VLIAATPDSQRIGSHLRELREAQVRYALDQLEPEERPIFIKSLEALVAGLTHTQGEAVLDVCQGAMAVKDDSPSAAANAPADPAPAPQVSASRVTSNPLHSPSLRGSD
jgi:hypothetical protein